MRRPEPMTRAIEISEVKSRLSLLVNEVSRNEIRIIVEEAGAPIAALVSLADLERLAQFEKQREQRFAVVDRMRAAFADVPTEEIEREAARAVAEVRAEMTAERRAPTQDR